MTASAPSAHTRSVLFVCLGNICRSPAAEGVMRRRLAENGRESLVEVDSAGLLAFHAGERADRRMRAAAERRDTHLGSIARQVTLEDFSRFDLIVAMDASNLRELKVLASEAGGSRERIRLLGSFLPEADPGAPDDSHEEVPDPYHGGPSGFEHVLDLLEAAMPAVIETLCFLKPVSR